MRRRSFAVLFNATATAFALIALILRLTIGDRFRLTGVIFYATPWPVLAVGTALLAVAWLNFGQRKIACFMAFIAASATVAWLQTSWRWNFTPAHRGDLRIVLWNVSRPNAHLPEVIARLRAQDADLIAIAEAQPEKISTLQRWRDAFPKYRVEPSRGEMLILVRGEIVSMQSTTHPGYFSTSVQTRIRGQSLRCVQVDFNAHPFATRKIPLHDLTAHILPLAGENLVLLGDFNTPQDSMHLRPLRDQLANAFDTAGTGLRDSWPFPFPVLSLDQIWTSLSLRVVRCQSFGSWLSDHRAVVADLDFAP